MQYAGDADSQFTAINLQSTDSEFESLCQPCQRDGQKSDSTGFCVDCGEYLCDACQAVHRKIKTLLGHVLTERKVEPTGGTATDDSGSVPSAGAVSKRCPEHGSKVIQYFCSQCCEACCEECVSTVHNICRTTFVPDITGYLSDLENPALKKELGAIANAFKEINKNLNAKTDESDQTLIEVTIVLKHLIQDVAAKFENLFKEVNTTITEVRDKYKTCSNFVICKVKDAEDVANNVASKAQTQKHDHDQMLQSMHTVNNLLPLLTEGISFGENGTYTKFLASMGKIRTFMETLREICGCTEYQAIPGSQLTNMNLETESDTETCQVVGAVVTSAWLIIADHANKKLKVFDNEQKKLITELQFPPLFFDA